METSLKFIATKLTHLNANINNRIVGFDNSTYTILQLNRYN